jgi:exodeoxyribonuclease VII small subunit
VNDESQNEAASDDSVSLEDRITRLELILTRLESDEIPLEQALELFEEGVTHVREAERVLSETQLRVEELLAGDKTRELDVDEP